MAEWDPMYAELPRTRQVMGVEIDGFGKSQDLTWHYSERAWEPALDRLREAETVFDVRRLPNLHMAAIDIGEEGDKVLLARAGRGELLLSAYIAASDQAGRFMYCREIGACVATNDGRYLWEVVDGLSEGDVKQGCKLRAVIDAPVGLLGKESYYCREPIILGPILNPNVEVVSYEDFAGTKSPGDIDFFGIL